MGIFDFLGEIFTDSFAWLATKLLIGWFEVKLWSLQFSYGIAKEIVDSLNLTDKIQNAFSDIDAKTMAIIYKVKIFDAINLIMNGYITTIVFRFLPF